MQLTESANPRTREIDLVSTLEMVRLMADEDARVAAAVAREAEPIARAIDAIAERFQRGGRVIYIGAGTSGRSTLRKSCPPLAWHRIGCRRSSPGVNAPLPILSKARRMMPMLARAISLV